MATDTKWVIRRVLTAILLAGLLGACEQTAPRDATGGIPPPEGPPEIRYEVVRRHALEFDVDLPSRPPGSQLELAAASYILGNLQLGGYSPRLDRVPVEDAVSSTNVVAFPPGGADPRFVVTVTYDTPDSGRLQMGREIGLFLELARALTVADPEHAVAFVALGAETADHRGTRRLARFLLDEGVEPSVISIRPQIGNEQTASVFGSCMEPGVQVATSFTEGECVDMNSRSGAVTEAGFQETRISGDIEEMGRALFEFLARPRS